MFMMNLVYVAEGWDMGLDHHLVLRMYHRIFKFFAIEIFSD